MGWRLANSLVRLRDQVNAAYPSRSKVSDGYVGDLAHQGGASDHNPNAAGVVCAADLTYDPNVMNIHAIADHIRVNRHPNLKYIISNRRIAGAWSNWAWQNYNGSNAHDKHAHFSVGVGSDGRSVQPYDDTTDWQISGGATPPPVSPPSAVLGLATVIATAVNVRTQPTSKSPQGGSKLMSKGMTFEYVAIVDGESVDGNNKWLKSKFGNYVSARWLSYGAAALAPAPQPPTKRNTALTTGPCNVRVAPRVNANLGGSRTLPAGVTFTFVRIVKGDSVRGNSNWYESDKGNFVWAGNIREV